VALKPTIFKFNINLSDLDRDYYQELNLTIAQHPSETKERMMARIAAYCINAQERLSFTKGLSEIEQPDIWCRTLDDQIALWIDVGEPDVDRIKKASHKAKMVKIYTFNSKSDVWYEQSKSKLSNLSVSIIQFKWEQIQAFAALLERTMSLSFMITANTAYVTFGSYQCEIQWLELQS
jgi:uncharacterized protein YaeQ